MPEITLAPCPFCAAKPVLRARRLEGRLAGYEVACACGCHLCRAWLGRTTKIAVRRVLAVAWNRRAESERVNSAGFRACPLCASPGVNVATDRAWLAGGHTRVCVTCGACGLALVPALVPGETVSLAEMRRTWNARFPVPAATPESQPSVEKALSYGFRELMWHLDQHWEALGGPTVRGDK